jgi:hypothetical protein
VRLSIEEIRADGALGEILKSVRDNRRKMK